MTADAGPAKTGGAPADATAGPASAQAAEAVARQSYGKLIAFLSARTRDVAAAEDALADAFAAALTDWPVQGIPRTPDAWLLTVARRRLIDQARQRRTHDGAADTLLLLADLATDADEAREIPDHRLALMFACAHPAIDAGVRAPLMLQTILGFDAATIASAFLVSPTTMGQRLVRAKARIRQAGIPFKVPALAELLPAPTAAAGPAAAERLAAVLDAIYAGYTEGWADPAGADAQRRNLAEESIWLGGLLATLLPDEPEALGLLALMLFAQARRDARRDPAGCYVPLAEQDMARWDARMIAEAESLLRRAAVLAQPGQPALTPGRGGETARGVGGPAGLGSRVGRFQLEAAIQSAHVVRRRSGRADWPAIECLYAALGQLTGSPVVTINRAVALAEVAGPAAALALLDELAADAATAARLADYQPWWAARAGLLQRLGDAAAADAAYARAIGLEHDPAVRAFLQQRRGAAA